MNATVAILLASILAAVAYIPVTIIAYRNVPFAEPWKGLFSYTVCPLFTTGMVFGIWLTDSFAPGMLAHLNAAHAHGAPQEEAATGFAISTPLAILLCYGWYRLLEAAARKWPWEGEN